MDVTPFRQFLSGHQYTSIDGFMLDAVNDGPSAPFLQFALDLRVNRPRAPRTVAAVKEHWNKQGCPPWVTLAAEQTWALYLLMRTMAIPRQTGQEDDQEQARPLTYSRRRELTKLG